MAIDEYLASFIIEHSDNIIKTNPLVRELFTMNLSSFSENNFKKMATCLLITDLNAVSMVFSAVESDDTSERERWRHKENEKRI